MRPASKPVALPSQFEARFIASRVLWFLPVFTVLLALFARMHSVWWPLFAAKYVLLLFFMSWLGRRKAGEERWRIERMAEWDVAFARSRAGESWTSDLLPLVIAVALGGALMAASQQDVRWFIVAGLLGVLLAVGVLLRWFIYDRWVYRQLRMLELRHDSMARSS